MKVIFMMLYRFINKIKRISRNYVFFCQTGYRVNLIGDITLINHNVAIGKNCSLYPGVMIWGDGPVEIGDNVNIGKDTVIYSSLNGGGVYIGNNTNIAAQCYIIDMDHGMSLGKCIDAQENSVKPVHIGNDCWIGANATILKGSNISDGAVVGAKALVKGSIASYGIAVGIPAKVIKERN